MKAYKFLLFSSLLFAHLLALRPALSAPGRTSGCRNEYIALVEARFAMARRARRGMVFPDAELQQHKEVARDYIAVEKEQLQKTYKWGLFIESLEPLLAQRLTDELRRQERFLPEFGRGDLKNRAELMELMAKLTFEVANELNLEFQVAEAEARREAVYQKVAKEADKGNKIHLKMDGEDFAKRVRDVLHEKLNGRIFHELSTTERAQLVEDSYRETSIRFRAVSKEVEDRLALLGTKSKWDATQLKSLMLQSLQLALQRRGEASLEALQGEERDKLLDELDTELYSQLAWLNDGFTGMTARLGSPWRQWVRMHDVEMKEKVLEALNDELANRYHTTFSEMPTAKRDALLDDVLTSVLSTYQTRPTFAMIGGGVGLPAAVGMLGGSYLPSQLAAGFAVLTGTVLGSLSVPYSYWVGGKTKPWLAQKSLSGWRNVVRAESGPTPLQREFARLATTATGLADQFKDGRNITKDSLIPLLDGLNDAAYHAQSQETAEWMVAASVLKTSLAFPDVQTNPMDAFSIYMKLKDRFGSAESVASIAWKIRDLAKRWGDNPNPGLEMLHRVLNPTFWNEFKPEKKISMAGDTDLRLILDRAKNGSTDEKTRHVALGALLFQSQHADSTISAVTIATFRLNYEDWLKDKANYEAAKALIQKKSVDFGVRPSFAIALLDILCTKEDPKVGPILDMLRGGSR